MMKIIELGKNGFAPDNNSIAEHLEEQAKWIRDGEYDAVRTVIVLIETQDGELVRNTCGTQCDLARTTGLLVTSAIRGV
jgi:hypothetical protein